MDSTIDGGVLDLARVRELCSRRDEVPSRAIAALSGAGKTVAMAESCTGGLCAALLTEVPGASAAFVSSAVVYQARAKSALCGLDPAFVARCGPVSAAVTRALAAAARERAAADLGLAITGWAGPEGGTAVDPIGTVYMALAQGDGVQVFRQRFEGDRAAVRLAAALTALTLVMTWAGERGGSIR